MNGKTLVFAEKPSVGRDLARVLGANRRGDGFLEGDRHVITWGIGHLVALGEPAVQNPDWKAWRLAALPMIPREWRLVVLPSTARQFEVVRELMHRPDVVGVVNAADAGREGELIFRLVYRQAECRLPVQRLWISSMTDDAIREGFTRLMPSADYDGLGAAAECRSRADWLVGMNCSRGYTKKFGQLLSVGRVQTPTLALVVRRHHEIAKFTPTDFWQLHAELDDFSAVWFDPAAADHPTRILDRATADDLAARCQGITLTVSKATKSKKKQPPPLLYDLTTLQREANARYGFTAARTLEIAQTLYEKHKVITYPRTDSRYLSNDVHPTLPGRAKALPPVYRPLLETLLAKGFPKTKRVFDDVKVSDHHAIIPTAQAPRSEQLSVDEKRLYDLVVRRFLAAFHPDHEYLATSIELTGRLAGGPPPVVRFKAAGRVTVVEGWKVCLESVATRSEPAGGRGRPPSSAGAASGAMRPDGDGGGAGEGGDAIDDADEVDSSQKLPELARGDTREVRRTRLDTRQTRPPPYYTEASLLLAMETAGKLVDDEEAREAMKGSGLGTPATRAEIIEKLIRVGYLARERKRLLATAKGIELIGLVEDRLKSPELTGSWEKRLGDIAKGRDDASRFMADIVAQVEQAVAAIKTGRFANVSRDALRRVFGACPKCGGGGIIEGRTAYGCNRWREGCSFRVPKTWGELPLPPAAIDALIAGRPSGPIPGLTESAPGGNLAGSAGAAGTATDGAAAGDPVTDGSPGMSGRAGSDASPAATSRAAGVRAAVATRPAAKRGAPVAGAPTVQAHAGSDDAAGFGLAFDPALETLSVVRCRRPRAPRRPAGKPAAQASAAAAGAQKARPAQAAARQRPPTTGH